jgi:hypothetical protein
LLDARRRSTAMMVTVYCSGGVRKGTDDEGKICWSDAERQSLQDAARPLDVRYFNPDDPVRDLSDALTLFGRDMYQVQLADFVVVDARQRRGIGIGVEMLAAKLLGTGLVVVAPQDSHYRQDELAIRGGTARRYVHPHVIGLADAIVGDFSEAGAVIRDHVANRMKPKGAEAVFDAMTAYKTTLLPSDTPTLEIIRERQQAPGALLS